jgi:hypothetical protein
LLLGLAQPVRAEAAGLPTPRFLWDWLASLWETGGSTLGSGSQKAWGSFGFAGLKGGSTMGWETW